MPASPRSSYNYYPGSGDVTQAINPWSWLNHSMGQFGLININQTVSSNRGMEAEIVQQAAGYGRQLGRIGDVVKILLERMGDSRLDPAQKRHVKEFDEMMAAIAAVKAGHAVATPENVDRLIAGIHTLKTKDHDAYAAIMAKLRKELFTGESPRLLGDGTRR